MEEDKEDSKSISRRQFIIGAGTVVVVGAVAGLAACVPSAKKDESQSPTPTSLTPTPTPTSAPTQAQMSGVIMHDATVCAGCGVCGMMCSLYHEGEVGPALSRSEIVRDPFVASYIFNVCQQCRSPSCYFACPLRDTALCVDEVTGVKYVNEDKCDGCGKCIKACPFDPPRIKLHPEKKVALNCNLCKGRESGPICVEYCGMRALTLVAGSERG